MNRIFLSVGAVSLLVFADLAMGFGCTEVETPPATLASTDSGARGSREFRIVPYDAAPHLSADAAAGSQPVCLRASANAAQANDASAFGYHAPMASLAACSLSELAGLAAASGTATFTTFQYDGATIAGVGANCAACLMAEYDGARNPPGVSAKWGVSGLRTDAAETSYVLPSNRNWLNTFGCLERANLLNGAEAQAASNANACRSMFCPLGSGGCGLASSREYAQCTQFAEGAGGPCSAVAALLTSAIVAKLDAAKSAGSCVSVQSVGSVFCGGAAESATDASVGQ